MIKRAVVLFFLSLGCLVNAEATETINLVTYYPVPFGAYDQIRLVPRSAAPTCNASTQGAMYIDSDDDKLYVCKNTNTWTTLLSNPDVWTQSGNNVYPSATGSNPNLLVGIRTITPANPLTVSGSASIGSGYAATVAPANGLIVQGNIGIGKNSAATPLDVVGDAQWTGTLQGGSVPWARLTSFPAACPANQAVTAVGSSLTCAATGGYWTASGSNIYSNNSGNVAIGTSTITNKLTVNGNASVGAGYIGNAAPANGMIVQGYVGIGTTTPGANKLYVRTTTGVDAAVYAENTAGVNDQGFGVYGRNDTNTGVRAQGKYGLWAQGTGNAAVLADNWSGWGAALRGQTNGGYAGDFDGDVHITGTLTVDSGIKNFVQPHPADPKNEIAYTALEGRDIRIFIDGISRLKEGEVKIHIPEDFRLVASEEKPFNVILTPFGKASLYVKERATGYITVAVMDISEDIEFGYLIIATRGGYEDSRPIQENRNFRPERGRGVKDFERKFIINENDTYYTKLGKELNRKLLIQNGTLNKDGTFNKKLAEKLSWQYQEFGDNPGGQNE